MKAAFLILTACAVSFSMTRAGLIISDSFDYSDGALVSASGEIWQAHSGTSGPVEVINQAVRLRQNRAEDVQLLLPGGPFNASSAEALYARFRVTFAQAPNTSGSYFAHFKNESSGFRGRVWARAAAEEGRIELGISSAASSFTAASPRTLPLNQAAEVVLRLNIADSVASLWVNPESEADVAAVSESGSAIAIAAFALRQASGMGEAILDDLRVGFTWEAVTAGGAAALAIVREPEDASVAAGQRAEFRVIAAGATQFQWFSDRGLIAGATGPVLEFASAALDDSGTYWAEVSDGTTTLASRPAQLTVLPVVAAPELAWTLDVENARRSMNLGGNAQITEVALAAGERCVIRVAARDLTQVPAVQFEGASGVEWEQAAGGSAGERLGVWALEATPAMAGIEHAPVVSVANGAGSVRQEWRVRVLTREEEQFILTEFLANPASDPASGHYNPLRRDTPSAPERIAVEDEFIEFMNGGSQDLDLSGWTISDRAAVRHVFDEGTVLRAGTLGVVFGGASSGSAPNIPALSWPASRGTAGLSLNNDNESVFVRNNSGGLVLRLDYGASSLSKSGSVTWNEAEGKFMAHAEVSALALSPGLANDGTAVGVTPGEGVGRVRIELQEGGVLLRWPAAADRRYRIRRADALSGVWIECTGWLQFEGGSAEWIELPNGAGAVFYRVEAE